MRKKQIDFYSIGNVCYPVLYKINNKPVGFDEKWKKTLGTIKRWTSSDEK